MNESSMQRSLMGVRESSVKLIIGVRMETHISHEREFTPLRSARAGKMRDILLIELKKIQNNLAPKIVSNAYFKQPSRASPGQRERPKDAIRKSKRMPSLLSDSFRARPFGFSCCLGSCFRSSQTIGLSREEKSLCFISRIRSHEIRIVDKLTPEIALD